MTPSGNGAFEAISWNIAKAPGTLSLISFGSLPLNGHIKSFPEVWQLITNLMFYFSEAIKSLIALDSGSEKASVPGQKSPQSSVRFATLSGVQSIA